MSVNAKMTAIADAIRAKTGGTSALTLDQMATEIAGITSGNSGDGNYSYYNDFHGLYTKIITVGANTVTNANSAYVYLQAMIEGTLLMAFLMDDYGGVNNQLIGIYDNTNQDTLRYRNGTFIWVPNANQAYDIALLEGTKYLLVSYVRPTV